MAPSLSVSVGDVSQQSKTRGRDKDWEGREGRGNRKKSSCNHSKYRSSRECVLYFVSNVAKTCMLVMQMINYC